jgi:hypothetical protein
MHNDPLYNCEPERIIVFPGPTVVASMLVMIGSGS